MQFGSQPVLNGRRSQVTSAYTCLTDTELTFGVAVPEGQLPTCTLSVTHTAQDLCSTVGVNPSWLLAKYFTNHRVDFNETLGK